MTKVVVEGDGISPDWLLSTLKGTEIYDCITNCYESEE